MKNERNYSGVIASALCEAISVTRGDCFVAKNAPRNDGVAEYLRMNNEE